MKTPERPLHDYMAEVSESTEVRIGVPLPLGTHESEGGANFAIFSRYASPNAANDRVWASNSIS